MSAEGWRPGEIARLAIRGLVELGQFLGNTAIVVGIGSPVWVPIGVLAWWLRRRRRAKAE